MSLDPRRPGPLGWVMAVGLLLEAVPPAASRPVMQAALRSVARRHRAVFGRLADLGDATFLIDPVDLPVHFLLRPAGSRPSLSMHRGDAAGSGWSAALRAPMLTLIDLLEGRLDGDAAFFGRDLTIEGDMGAALVLRNALEEGNVRVLPDLLAELGPLGKAFGRLLGRMAPWAAQADHRLRALQSALLQPHSDRLAALDAVVAELQAAVQDRPRSRKRP